MTDPASDGAMAYAKPRGLGFLTTADLDRTPVIVPLI